MEAVLYHDSIAMIYPVISWPKSWKSRACTFPDGLHSPHTTGNKAVLCPPRFSPLTSDALPNELEMAYS
jgi:hypothetical protein